MTVTVSVFVSDIVVIMVMVGGIIICGTPYLIIGKKIYRKSAMEWKGGPF